MVLFPNAKINIGLNVLSKREDTYHNLETVFYPIPLCDILEFKESDESQNSFQAGGITISTSTQSTDNLVIKAYHLLQKEYDLPFMDFYLEKIIPIGAGLGGGSSDASFTLKGINDYFQLNLSTKKLQEYAASLGADCPFFIYNKAAFAEGIGGELTPIALDLKEKYLLLLYPNIAISTQIAYANVKVGASEFDLRKLTKTPIECWKEKIKNDFEESVFTTHPILADYKKQLYQAGALYAAMSGSGSAIFGLFNERPKLGKICPSQWVFKL